MMKSFLRNYMAGFATDAFSWSLAAIVAIGATLMIWLK